MLPSWRMRSKQLRAAFVGAATSGQWHKVRALAEALASSFPDDPEVFQNISYAFSQTGDNEAAAHWARCGIAEAFADKLLTRLLMALASLERYDDAIAAWHQYKSELTPGGVERFLLANMLAIYDRSGRRREGLKELDTWVVRSLEGGPGKDGGLLTFNLACLYSAEGKPEMALRFMQFSLDEGKDRTSFETDADLSALRAHPAYRIVATRAPESRAWQREGNADDVVELVIRGNELTERRYDMQRTDIARDVQSTEYEHLSNAALAYVSRCSALDEGKWTPCDLPATVSWPGELEDEVARLAAMQAAGELAVLGAMVIDWDYGDSPADRHLWIAGYEWDEREATDCYVYGDGALTEMSLSGPPIDTPRAFETIIAAVIETKAFEELDKKRPFHFILQEHDTGHECTVSWPPAET